MARKSLYTDFVDIGTLLETFKNSKEMQKAIKRKNLFDMWEKTAGAKFAKKSKPYSIIHKTMVIACQNSVVAQELQLQKIQLLTKLNPYLKALKMNIIDLRFDTKRWVDEED